MHYVKMENGEPRGQPMLKDIMLADAQVINHVPYIWVSMDGVYLLEPSRAFQFGQKIGMPRSSFFL